MEETNFVLLWKEQYEKIDQALVINKKLLLDSISQKAENALRSLIRSKAIGVTAAILYLAVLGFFLFIALFHYRPAANYFIISIGAIFLFNVKAIYDYIRHMVMAGSIDYNGNVVEIQQRLNLLQLSIARHIRTMFLQMPFWTTFFLSSTWFPSQVSGGYVALQITLTSLFAGGAVFLYRNLTPKNMEKRWVKSILSGAGAKKVTKALVFYKEIEEFKVSA
jgi:hypothetical protein